MHSNQRAGGVALIAAVALLVFIVVLHPTAVGGAEIHGIDMGELVHAVAFGVSPLLIFGMLVVAQRQGLERWPVLLGFVFYAVGSIVGMLAPAVSGLVMPQVVEAAREGGAAGRETFDALGHLAFWLNQAVGAVNYALWSVALLLWSAAWRGRGALDATIRVWGAVAAVGVLAWQVVGSGHIGVHELGAVVLALGGWHLLVAVWMLRARGDVVEAQPPAG